MQNSEATPDTSTPRVEASLPKPRILVLANQKGGVGKTTTAINLGTALAAIGERVLIIDLDPQGNASTGLGIDRRSRSVSTYDVLIGEAPLRDAVVALQADDAAKQTATTRAAIAADRAALIKYWITDTQFKLIDECLHLFGGYGYMMEYPIAELFVDARVQRIYGGTNEIMKELASRFM